MSLGLFLPSAHLLFQQMEREGGAGRVLFAPSFPSAWAGGAPSPGDSIREAVCTGPSKGLGCLGFAAHLPGLAGTRV